MRSYFLMKRVVDLMFAVLLLFFTMPVMLVIAVLIKLNSPGPILFRQERPGKNCKVFTVNKFRTMRVVSEQGKAKLSDMDRITKVGSFLRKTSLDELPQLFNILRGEMSFIGPRPLLIQYLDKYTGEQNRRHEVTPGISGWAQVNGRNAISWEQKFKLDVWYVENIGFLVDLKIMFLTIRNVFLNKDINNSGADTMPVFTGSKPQSIET